MRKTIIKIISVLLCIATLVSLCGCGDGKSVIETLGIGEKDTVDPGIDNADFSVPFLRTDSLDPFKATETVNQYITRLLYDSLFTVDNSFKINNVIAEGYSLSEKSLSVNIKSGLKFTDNTDLTSADVVYSFEQAKDCSAYSSYLENITQATASGTSCVVFTLKNSNSDEAANLIFPIIKANSEAVSQEDDDSTSDSPIAVPVGSGRYTVVTENGKRYLLANKARLGGYHPIYNRIGLVDVTSTAAFANLFNMNEIDFYCDNFDEGKYSKISNIGNKIELTNFVYLGINSQSTALSNSRVRRAVALALDRAELASVSFASCATATALPFRPSYYKLESLTLPTLKSKKEATISLLEENGFDKVSDSGIRYSEDTSLNLTLLVNSNNDFRRSLARGIQQALEKVDIKVTIREVSYNSYVSLIESESFDLYIGEAVLSNTFGLSRFFSESGSLRYGIDLDGNSARLYTKYENGEAELRNFADAFSEELPFIPIAFRQGVITSSNRLKNEITTIPNDCFANIDEWTV